MMESASTSKSSTWLDNGTKTLLFVITLMLSFVSLVNSGLMLK